MEKRKLSFWQIWNMSFGFLGIQMGFALQNSNVSRIFQTLGANIDDIPILWVAAPLTGLIIQPIIGYFSDRTWTKLGRRKPYFLAGAILASAALFFLSFTSFLKILTGWNFFLISLQVIFIKVPVQTFQFFHGLVICCSVQCWEATWRRIRRLSGLEGSVLGLHLSVLQY